MQERLWWVLAGSIDLASVRRAGLTVGTPVEAGVVVVAGSGCWARVIIVASARPEGGGTCFAGCQSCGADQNGKEREDESYACYGYPGFPEKFRLF